MLKKRVFYLGGNPVREEGAEKKRNEIALPSLPWGEGSGSGMKWGAVAPPMSTFLSYGGR
jgi:hypothetical protein